MTIQLSDGRQVQAAECLTLEQALVVAYIPELIQDGSRWFISCSCCQGRGTHPWSPSGPGDGGEYPCQPCGGRGEFPVVTPEQKE